MHELSPLNTLFILLVFIPCTSIISGQHQSKNSPQEHQNQSFSIESGGPATINITNQNYPSFNNVNNNKPKMSATAHIFSSISSNVSNFIDARLTQIMKTSPQEYAQSIATWITKHKGYLVKGSIATTYASLSIALISGNAYINRTDIWASWKSHMSAQEMQQYPQEELQNSLHEEILKRYLAKASNRLSCYLEFMKAIEQEEKRIARHIVLAQIIKRSKLMRIFPINDKKIKRARIAQKRLAFIKHIFVSWAAQKETLRTVKTTR